MIAVGAKKISKFILVALLPEPSLSGQSRTLRPWVQASKRENQAIPPGGRVMLPRMAKIPAKKDK
jgi:hypothetical protein